MLLLFYQFKRFKVNKTLKKTSLCFQTKARSFCGHIINTVVTISEEDTNTYT